ncbi:MAG: hypothetical protein E6J34_14125 [Chloroflexi bacterium]|nr:MAG: hypothetical protein E6J34_14125 [Chloroflexota bacterium]
MFEIQLFGKFCVRYNGQILDGFDARKVQELFCYLLLHRDHAYSREMLASLLWPDSTTAQSKKNLRQVLWQLQSALRSTNKPIDNCMLLVDADQIQLAARANLFWLDVAVLEQACKLVHKISGQEMDAQKAQVLEDQLTQDRCLPALCDSVASHEETNDLLPVVLDRLMQMQATLCDLQCEIQQSIQVLKQALPDSTVSH